MPGGPLAGPGDDCDAALAPVVTGRVDHDLLDRLARRLAPGPWTTGQPGQARCGTGCGGPHGHGRPGPGGELSRGCARELILANAVALLSGPGGLASWLRTGTLPQPAASVSLPLDVGTDDSYCASCRRVLGCLRLAGAGLAGSVAVSMAGDTDTIGQPGRAWCGGRRG